MMVVRSVAGDQLVASLASNAARADRRGRVVDLDPPARRDGGQHAAVRVCCCSWPCGSAAARAPPSRCGVPPRRCCATARGRVGRARRRADPVPRDRRHPGHAPAIRRAGDRPARRRRAARAPAPGEAQVSPTRRPPRSAPAGAPAGIACAPPRAASPRRPRPRPPARASATRASRSSPSCATAVSSPATSSPPRRLRSSCGAPRAPDSGAELPMPLKHPQGPSPSSKANLELPPAISMLEGGHVPRHHMPPAELMPDVAYQIIHDELMIDGNARLNLATFVTTWMEPQAQRLMAECFDKNMIDKDEYPQTAEIEMRCVNILSRLWHAPDGRRRRPGCSTTGSSEAAMLGGLALKRRWQQRRAAAEGKPADKPNIVMGINVQICWEKFANYWDVEMRLVPMEGDRFHALAGGGGEAAATRTRSASWRSSARRSTAPTSRSRRSARRSTPSRRTRDRRAGARRRRLGRVRRAVHRPGAGVGLPAAARGVDQRLRATSTGSSTPASAGSSGATRTRCRRT